MLENIPAELRKYEQWVVWKKGYGKNSKRPYNARTMAPASVKDPATWSTFDEARQAVLNELADGVGFVLTEEDPFTFIDLDDVIKEEYIEPWAEELIKRLASFTEVSQSGTGIHILIKGEKPGDRSKSEQLEVYDQGHYFALTGNLWKESPHTLEERQSELSQLYNEQFTDGAVCEEADYRGLADGLVLDRAAEPPSEKLKALHAEANFLDTWKHNRGFSSLSEYDLALASFGVDNHWSDQEIADLIIAFRRRHGGRKDLDKAMRPDYIARTIGKATSGRTAERSCKLTDVGNAKRLALRHGKNLHYCYSMKKWLVWKGVRWEPDDLGQVTEMAKDTIRSIYPQAANIKDYKERIDFNKAIRRTENNPRIKAMKELAQSVPGVPILPSHLNTDPWKLNVQNGTVDLMTGELLPHNRDDLITKLAPVDYIPGVRSELFEDFLARVLPDKEVRSFVQRAAGYTLYGRNEEEIILFVYGPPASGKSTFLAAVSAALGDYAAMADFGTFLRRERSSDSPRADVARLDGRRLVISQEAEAGAKLYEPLVNQLTGMDLVTVRHLYQESFEFIPQFTPWLAANSRPQINSPDGGIWRRLREIPFDQVIPEQERDRELKRKLREEPVNRTGILNWLVEGCLAWRREGLGVPEDVREATDDYREEMDFIGQFLEDCTVRGPGYVTSNKDMRNAYTRWCKRNSFQPVGTKTFTQNLKPRGLEQVSGGDRSWKGVKLVLDSYSDI